MISMTLLKTFVSSFVLLALVLNFAVCGPIDEPPRYTAARLADQWKHILEGSVELSDSNLFEGDVVVHDCGESGDYNYLAEQVKELVPKLQSVEIFVKFAYPIPFANNSIQFSIDETLSYRDGSTSHVEKAMFARLQNPDKKDDDYQIFEMRSVPCTL